ncbi:MAG TPA: aldo/keto reductase, partial [Planctomycetota bacterium]|nr:aldo/keto reductase [Planctomycetota bacterium]
MDYRKLGKSDLDVSEISFGCWTLGGLNWVNGQPNGWADVDEDEVTEAVRVGLDAGVNHFDNADVYGNGRAERMLARVLDRLGVKHDAVTVATKVGHFPGTAEHAYEPAHIRHQCEQSLINLRRDTLDLYYFHHGNFGDNDRYLDDAVDVMNRLVAEGKVRWVGLSAYSEGDFARLAPAVKPVCLQSSSNALGDKYIREGSPTQKLMAEHDLVFVAFGPLVKGLLLDKYDPEHPPEFEP